ncbi:unnamed protein product [Closterium sp. NIES-65]|nr:unnamed protein product [Closterium sp. NIES-65]
MHSQVCSQVHSQVCSQMHSQVCSQMHSQVCSQMHSQVCSQVHSQVCSQMHSQVCSQMHSQVCSQVNSQSHPYHSLILTTLIPSPPKYLLRMFPRPLHPSLSLFYVPHSTPPSSFLSSRPSLSTPSSSTLTALNPSSTIFIACSDLVAAHVMPVSVSVGADEVGPGAVAPSAAATATTAGRSSRSNRSGINN